MPTAKELYSQAVAPMPAAEQLRLASFILEGLDAAGALNCSDQWSDEDIRDLTAFSMTHAMKSEGQD